MSKAKRAFSAFLASAMLVALAAPAAFAAKSFSSTGSDQTDYLTCSVAIVASLDTCSTVADGLSTITLTADTGDSDSTAEQMLITVSGATVVSSTMGTVSGNTVSVLNDEALSGNLVVRAPATAGTGTVSVAVLDPSTGVASQEGTLTLTFTASSGLQVSEGQSLVKIVANNNCDNNADADNTGTTGATISGATAVTNAAASGGSVDLCVVVRNANGDPVDAETVRVTITPVGLVNGSQTATVDPGADGIAIFDLTGSGVSGTSTITIAVTDNNVTTTFGARTFVWSGALSTLTLSNERFVGQDNGVAVEAIKLVGKDAAGNTVTPSGVTWNVSGGTGTLTVGADGDADGIYDVTCAVGASGTFTITARSGSVTSNSVTYICSPAPATTDTYTVAFEAANIAPGGATRLCVTFKNSAGQPVPDATYAGITALVSSGALGAFGTTSNGMACATYLAPFASGQVSAVVTPGGGLTPTNRTASITIGAPATSAGSALGIAPNGPFTTTTKIQVRGRYVTFRFDLGVAAANKPVTILAATKTGLTWSGFTAVTTRIANAQGVVIYYVRQSTATWKSYRAQESTTNVTPARQARWR